MTVHRDAVVTPKPPAKTKDPPVPEVSPPPSWFRSAKVTVRIVDSQLIALQLDLEVDVNTMTEEKLQGQMANAPANTQMPRGKTLNHGTPVGPNNPADGIMAMRVLVQTDPSTGRWTTLLSVGADPADTDGLVHFGWVPLVDPMPPSKDLGVTFLGSYLSFWPMLAAVPPVDAVRNAAEGREGGVVDAVLAGSALVVPGIVAALPWFAVERVILFGAEYLHSQRGDGFTGTLLADIEIDWSIDLFGLVTIKREQPLKIRYKAIGLSLTNRDGDDDGTSPGARWDFRPVFDSTRGYTIDVASGGGLHIAEPLGQILRVLGARLSRSNPMTLEVDIALGVDLGVVAIDQASVRAYLDDPTRLPELTALAARIDIPGVIAGAGYMRIGNEVDSQGNKIGTIGGQLDLTIRPVSVRVCAAVEVATITEAATGRQTTGVYVGLSVVLPAGIPLGSTGLGIFGFRGIFGMHYERNAEIGANTGVPALAWLKAAGGQPHLLRGPDLTGPGSGVILWKPKIDSWAFGVGILIGTMEGGYLINLDGTFLLELPGPRVLIMMNARIVSPPPSVGELGMTVGILAVIEITPDHFLIGILVTWEVESLVKIVIPVEAVFPFGEDAQDWHIYLGARKDYGQSVEVDVLGIVKGTGYLMFRGNGLAQFNNGHATLPELTGFSIAFGAAASFTWGDVDAGLYIKVGGGMDAEIGFKPFTLAGNIYVAGELRLWIVSVGADASLTVLVAENDTGDDLKVAIHGQACGHVDFFFFSVSGCVDIEISGPDPTAPFPSLVEKVSLQSRSPALAQGSAVDRGVDTSLGQAPEQTGGVPADGDMPVVPIDAIPVISMLVPPVAAAAGVTIGGLGTPLTSAPVDADGFAERSGDRYHYEITALRLERVKGNGQLDSPVLAGGSGAGAAPAVWWTINPPTEASPRGATCSSDMAGGAGDEGDRVHRKPGRDDHRPLGHRMHARRASGRGAVDVPARTVRSVGHRLGARRGGLARPTRYAAQHAPRHLVACQRTLADRRPATRCAARRDPGDRHRLDRVLRPPRHEPRTSRHPRRARHNGRSHPTQRTPLTCLRNQGCRGDGQSRCPRRLRRDGDGRAGPSAGGSGRGHIDAAVASRLAVAWPQRRHPAGVDAGRQVRGEGVAGTDARQRPRHQLR